MVKYVVELRADLHAEALVDVYVLREHHVGVGVVRAIELVAACVAEMAEEGVAEVVRVQAGGYAARLNARSRERVQRSDNIGQRTAAGRDSVPSIVERREHGV